jgi:hypothetical protein
LVAFYSKSNRLSLSLFTVNPVALVTHPYRRQQTSTSLIFLKTRPGWAPDPLMVGIRSPDELVVGSCTSHPGVLGSIPKRETTSTLLLPPREQLCHRSCSNKTHTHLYIPTHSLQLLSRGGVQTHELVQASRSFIHTR